MTAEGNAAASAAAKVAVGDPKGRIENVGSNTEQENRSSSPGYMKNAHDALQRAENCNSSGDYAGAVKDLQICIEQSIKALLVHFGVKPPKEHDVSDRLSDAIKVLENRTSKSYAEQIEQELRKAPMLSEVLQALRKFANYGEETEISAAALFDENFGKKLCDALFPEIDSVYRSISQAIDRSIH